MRMTDNAIKGDLLVVIDVQKDFYDPSGSLYVGGSETLPKAIADVACHYKRIILTLDWHPADHCSFKANGGIWPSHCVAYTQGAGLPGEFTSILERGKDEVRLFLKGRSKDLEEYGAFDNLEDDDIIKEWFLEARDIHVAGIAGDYCVRQSVERILRYVPSSKISLLKTLIRSIDDGSTLRDFARKENIQII